MRRLDFGFERPSQSCCLSVESIWALQAFAFWVRAAVITENDQTRCSRADREHKRRNYPLFFRLAKQMFGGSFPPFPCPSPTSPPPLRHLFALMWQMSSWLILPGHNGAWFRFDWNQRRDIYVVIKIHLHYKQIKNCPQIAGICSHCFIKTIEGFVLTFWQINCTELYDICSHFPQ